MSRASLDLPESKRALLAELRRAHRAEQVAPALRARVVRRLEAADRAPKIHIAPHHTSASSWLASRPVYFALCTAVLVALSFAGRTLDSWREDPAATLGAEPQSSLSPAADTVTEAPRPDPASEARSDAPAAVEPSAAGARPCPLEEMPEGALSLPERSEADAARAGLTLHTLHLGNEPCGSMTRRYLTYVPASLPSRANVPVLVLLHDSGESAERMRGDATRRHFEVLAKRQGFVLVYANAGPGKTSRAGVPNSGGWQTDEGASPYVDDHAYLERVIADLGARGVIGDGGDVFIAGHRRGGTMALAAAAERPYLYTGVAAFMPERSVEPPHVPPLRLLRKLVVFHGARVTTAAGLVAENWAAALGIPRGSGQRWARNGGVPRRSPGHSTRGAGRGSHVIEQLDFSMAVSGGPAVRVLALDTGSDPFPPFEEGGRARAAERSNQGFLGAEEAWRFLVGADVDAPTDGAAPEPVTSPLEDDPIANPPIEMEGDVVRFYAP